MTSKMVCFTTSDGGKLPLVTLQKKKVFMVGRTPSSSFPSFVIKSKTSD